jgi:H+-transporting ATPase
MIRLISNRVGLSSSEVKERLQKFGSNEIAEKKASAISKFLSNFWGPIPWMIEAAAILSLLIQHWEDFGIIFTPLMVNSSIRFWEENKAENAIELLKNKLNRIS